MTSAGSRNLPVCCRVEDKKRRQRPETLEVSSVENAIADPLVENVIVDNIADVVRLEASPEGVAIVTLQRPAEHNALNALAIEGLAEAFETLHGAEGVRIVFLRGAQGTFGGGLDRVQMTVASADWSEDEVRSDAAASGRLLAAVAATPALTVALVEGAVRGLGVGLVAACDIAVARYDAVFAVADVKLGLLPTTIAPYLMRAVGARQAQALLALGRSFDAAEARRLGLVEEVVESAADLDRAMDRLIDWAMTSAPDAMAGVKTLVADLANTALDHQLTEDLARRYAERWSSPEAREGVASYIEKRKPLWAR
jgi:enoyl-CoA hydratase/carnithine racemase